MDAFCDGSDLKIRWFHDGSSDDGEIYETNFECPERININ